MQFTLRVYVCQGGSIDLEQFFFFKESETIFGNDVIVPPYATIDVKASKI
jgi:hypothetical protein